MGKLSHMDFKEFFFGMPPAERKTFAQQVGSSAGFLTQLAYRNKAVELGFGDVIVTLSKREVSLDGIELTDNARRQRRIREGSRPDVVDHSTTSASAQ
jgi:hypothetical protein